MTKETNGLKLIVEIIGIMCSVFGVLSLILLTYCFPSLVFGYEYQLPPLAYLLMSYYDSVNLDHLISDKTWLLLVLTANIIVFFLLSKILNNLMEKQLRSQLYKEKRKEINLKSFSLILLQFGFFVVLAISLFFLVFHL